MVLVVILSFAVYWLYTQDTMTNTNVAGLQSSLTSLQTKVSALTGNVNDIATVTQLSTTVTGLSSAVAALQANPVPANATAVTIQTNPTVSAVTNANAVAFALDAIYTLTHYTFTVSPVVPQTGGGLDCYVDIPLIATVNQGMVVANRGICNIVTSPSVSDNIINDIRTNISADGTTARLNFTANNSMNHQLSVTILSK